MRGVEGDEGDADRSVREGVVGADAAGATPCFRGDMFSGLFEESGVLYSAVNERKGMVSKRLMKTSHRIQRLSLRKVGVLQ